MEPHNTTKFDDLMKKKTGEGAAAAGSIPPLRGDTPMPSNVSRTAQQQIFAVCGYHEDLHCWSSGEAAVVCPGEHYGVLWHVRELQPFFCYFSGHHKRYSFTSRLVFDLQRVKEKSVGWVNTLNRVIGWPREINS